jgi:hypothetical protein
MEDAAQWNNECETAIGDMEFNADDTKEDVQLKLKVRRGSASPSPVFSACRP